TEAQAPGRVERAAKKVGAWHARKGEIDDPSIANVHSVFEQDPKKLRDLSYSLLREHNQPDVQPEPDTIAKAAKAAGYDGSGDWSEQQMDAYAKKRQAEGGRPTPMVQSTAEIERSESTNESE